MTTYRVPVQLLEAPGPATEPPFQDVQDFVSHLLDALGIYARIGATFTGDLTLDAVHSGDRLRHDVYVVIEDPATVGVPGLDDQEVTGTAAAVRVVARALVQIGYTAETAPIDVDDVVELADPNGI